MALPDQVELLCMAVQKKAQEQAEKILEDARRRHERMVQDGISRIKVEQEQQKQELRRRAYQEARRKVDAAELRGRRMVMAARERIFQQVLDSGRKRLRELAAQGESYKKLLEAMIERAAGVIMATGEGGMEIRCRKEDMKMVEEILTELSPRFSARLILSSQPVDIDGGIIALSEDGKQLVDLSFSTIVSRIEPEIRASVAESLFKEAGAS